MKRLLGTLLRCFLNLFFNRWFEAWGAGPRKTLPHTPSLDDMMTAAAKEGRPFRLMWVGAHPDDESFVGSVLAKASIALRHPLHMVVLTHGEGGETGQGEVSRDRPLAEVRRSELEEVARLYNATVTIEGFFNASLPVSSFPYRHEIAQRWRDHRDPVEFIASEIRTFRPDAVLTFSPHYGATGHPEHQLCSRFTTSAVRLAADSDAPLGSPPHRVSNVYYMVSRYWFLRLAGMKKDPVAYTETFDLRQPCISGKRCVDVMADNTRPHVTQNADMTAMRLINQLFYQQYLHRVDLSGPTEDPYEEHRVRGMG
jgi:LmbE family N-acetylglucosaminyl deacetylase